MLHGGVFVSIGIDTLLGQEELFGDLIGEQRPEGRHGTNLQIYGEWCLGSKCKGPGA